MARPSQALAAVRNQLRLLGNAARAEHATRFFKTGPGDYGEGDRLLGLKVPDVRRLSRRCGDLTFVDLRQLLASPIHEQRQLALFVLVLRFGKADKSQQKKIYDFYMRNRRGVNNWDLVDGSPPHIVGAYLADKDRSILHEFARSKDLWERRIAIVATYHFIRHDDFDDTLQVAEQLLEDHEDLIHKAVGWMLREVGNRDVKVEKAFLDNHYRRMPRTMLRYAIERFPERQRQRYLKGTA